MSDDFPGGHKGHRNVDLMGEGGDKFPFCYTEFELSRRHFFERNESQRMQIRKSIIWVVISEAWDRLTMTSF